MTTRKVALRRAVLITAAVFGFALIGASSQSAADITTPQCNPPDPQGRNFCVTIEDLDGVSPSGTFGTGKTQTTVTAFQYYHFTFENKAGSTLTNGTLSVNLTDVTPSGNVASTASFVSAASAPFCTQAANTTTVSCRVGSLAGNSPTDFYLVYRTSTTPGVTATLLSGSAGFKEGTNGANGANPSTTTVSASTSLERNAQDSVAYSPPGQTTKLGTDPTTDTQFSTLQFSVPMGNPAFESRLSEGAGTLCAPALKGCFGQVVTSSLPAADGTFTPTNLFHLTMTFSLSDPTTPKNTNNIVMVHQPDSGPAETISVRCSSSPPASTDALPCITVTKDNSAKLLIIEVWAFHNGGWHPGLS
ncbi:MAG: hypothetical protein ACJ74D_03775 [Gaiellaceae bacterium]